MAAHTVSRIWNPICLFLALILVVGAEGRVCADSYKLEQTGVAGGYGEAGGDMDMLDLISGNAVELRLYQTANGGAGGYGDDAAVAGDGGFARSILTGLYLGEDYTYYETNAKGGAGGYRKSSSSASGGDGGNAVAGLQLVGDGDVSGSATATGGSGGYAYKTGNGGNGGSATLETVYGASTSGGTVNLDATVKGGSGGAANGSGNGGEGASESLVNAVDGDSTKTIRLNQTATAGSGGSSSKGKGGAGGSAESRLSASKDSSYLWVWASATAGSGGYSYYGDGGDGGDAIALSEATNTGTSYSVSTAKGGGGGAAYTGGAAGDGGYGSAYATGTGESDASVSGGSGGYARGGGDAGDGGSADAYAWGAIAWAYANGGSGGSADDGGAGGKGGNAVAISEGKGRDSYSSADGGDGGDSEDGDGGNGGSAVATASHTRTGSSVSVSAVAYGGDAGVSSSGSGKNGKSGDALATATGEAASGNVYATAVSKNSGSGFSVTAKTSAPVRNNIASTAKASANIDGSIKGLADAQGLQAAAFGTALPSGSDLEALVAANSNVQSAFGDGSVFVGYGVLGGSASGDDSMTISSSLKFNFTINDSTASEDLLVGLLCSNSTGSGFESLAFTISGENGTLFNETFLSFDLAETFFNNNVIDLGVLSDLVGDDLSSTLTFVLSLTASDASGYDFNFVYGAANSSPVPIPGAVWLFGSGLAVLTGMRRSRRG